MKTFKKLYTEAKIFKTGDTVMWTDQDGDDKKVKIVSYDKKRKLYVIDLKGREMEAEPEELNV